MSFAQREGGVESGMAATVQRANGAGHAVLRLGAILACLIAFAAGALAQTTEPRIAPIPIPVPQRIEPVPQPQPQDDITTMPRETVQADVSTRNVPVTSTFSGTEIVVFGAVDYSRQPSAEAGLYDVVIVVVGTATPLTVRRKSRVAGLWLNTDALTFDSVPSYYAIASTRPLDEVASQEVLQSTGIGFDYVPMELSEQAARGRTAAEIRDFRQAIVNLKSNERLYHVNEYAVAFIGRSLFRATIDVPANVVVGPFETRVYLFRNGELLSDIDARLVLRRQGFEELLHDLAFHRPFTYGLMMVAIAMGAGLLAAIVFRGASQ